MKDIASAVDATTQPSATPSAAGKSIAVKATILAQTAKEADDARAKAAELLDSAIKNFEAAASAANNAGKDMSELADRQASMAPIVKIAKNVLAPQVYKLQLATAERVLAESAAAKAGGISARIKLRDTLTPLMGSAGLAMPKELADTTLDKQLTDAIADADAKYKDAIEHLTDIIDGPPGESVAQATRKSASITRIFVLYGQGKLAAMQGKKDEVASKHKEAVAAVKAAAELQVRRRNRSCRPISPPRFLRRPRRKCRHRRHRKPPPGQRPRLPKRPSPKRILMCRRSTRRWEASSTRFRKATSKPPRPSHNSKLARKTP
jgi:hypothetical protein